MPSEPDKQRETMRERAERMSTDADAPVGGDVSQETPKLDPVVAPAVVAEVTPEMARPDFVGEEHPMTGVAGALPENAGRDEADVHRDKDEGGTPGKAGRSLTR